MALQHTPKGWFPPVLGHLAPAAYVVLLASERVVVVGGGIAGSALPDDFRPSTRVPGVLVEAEGQLAQHTTGRSAAQLIENYGAVATRPLRGQPADFSVDLGRLSSTVRCSGLDPADDRATRQTESLLAPWPKGGRSATPSPSWTPTTRCSSSRYWSRDRAHRAVLKPDAADIDVAGLHQAFVRGFRRLGGRSAPRHASRCRARRRSGMADRCDRRRPGRRCDRERRGRLGDVVAERAGVSPIGLRALRRTACMVTGPEGSSGWPRWPMPTTSGT